MTFNLDHTDVAIINSLMEDGRKSFRQISREIKVSAPTVELRFNRMRKQGIIKGIEPILNTEKIENIISGFVYLKVNPSELSNVVDKVSAISEIKGIFVITGDYNIVIKIIAKDLDHMNRILNEEIYAMEEIISASLQMITKIIKDEPGFTIKEGQLLKAKCIYCYNDIKNHSRTIRINHSEKYFCCHSCLTLYKQRYGEKFDLISK